MKKPSSFCDEHRVLPGDGHVVEEDVAVRRAADRRALALRDEVLTRAAPPERTTSAGPSAPSSSSVGDRVLLALLGVKLMVVSEPAPP